MVNILIYVLTNVICLKMTGDNKILNNDQSYGILINNWTYQIQ